MCDTIQDLKDNADALGIDYNDQEIEYAVDVLDEYIIHNENPTYIDFTDMIYIPATNENIDFPISPQLVFIDECQDLNACQHALLDRLIKKNKARFVACGDPQQSIYGFAGAHSESFNIFLEKPNVKEMPLSICYRCPQRVVARANMVYDIMESWDQKQEGECRDGDISEVQEGDMIICRNIKPLVGAYFDLLAQGKKAVIKGKDLGKGLISLIKPYQSKVSVQVMLLLEARLEEKKVELVRGGIDNPTTHPGYINLLEKVEVIRFISKRFTTALSMIRFLEGVFADTDRKGVVLSTIHKSKGLENPNVFILDKKLIPSKYAKTPDQIIQESNLLYVAITRAQSKLIFINTPK
jgi:DNA helicase-2/ATP-dependent DNA helicase PcrA